MDKSLLMYRGGVRATQKTLADGKEHTLHFKARTPSEVAQYLAAEARFENTDVGVRAREKMRADFIADSLCTETGEPLMTASEALLIPATLKPEICMLVVQGSSELGTDAGKD